MKYIRMTYVLIFFISAFIVLFLPPWYVYSIQSDQQSTTKKSEQSQIDLPDVVIYGTEKTMRTSGEKLSATRERTTLLKRDVDYSTPKHTNFLASEKLNLSEPVKTDFRTSSVFVQYGTFKSPVLELMHWQEFKKFNFGVAGGYRRSAGEFDNSFYTIGNGRINVGVNITPQFSVTSHGTIFRSDYGMYGSTIDNLKRTVAHDKIDVSSKLSFSPTQSATVELMMIRSKLTDESSLNNYTDDFEDNLTKVSAGYIASLPSRFQLFIDGNYLRNSHTEAASRPLEYLSLITALRIPVNPYFSLQPFVNYEKISDKKNRVSPGLEIMYLYQDKIGFRVKGNRYYQPLFYYDLWQFNKYLSSDTAALFTNNRYNVEFNLEYTPWNEFVITGGLLKNWFENFYYWQRNADKMFQLNQFEKVNITKISVGCEYNLSNNIEINPSFIYIVDNIEDIPLPFSINSIPYLEDFRMPVTLIVRLPHKTSLQFTGTWIGERRVDTMSDKTLTDYISTSVNGEAQVGPFVTLIASVDNIINSDYEQWEGYPELGVRFFIGLKCKW